jgi:3-(methylthio)propanoyl-CoA dehydrogenase
MANFYESNPDMQFNTDHWIEWDGFVPQMESGFSDAKKFTETKDARYEFAPTTTEEALTNYKAVFEAYAQIIDGELYPHLREIDNPGMQYKDGKVTAPAAQVKFIDTLREAQILTFSVSRDYGGQNFGLAARMPITEMVARADIGTQIIISYFNMSEMIEFYGSDEMKKKYLPLFAEGKMLGAMALTEPNIGSDLTNAATKATKKEDGSFVINGTKIFITQGGGFGEAKAAIFTIARSLDKKGAFGLSFFLVESDDIHVSRIEEKVGLHSSATCEILYENSKAQLIGDEGAGLVKYAINMMNGARIGIACQSLGIAEAAYREAEKYAEGRIQFGVPIIQLTAVKRMLDESEARVHGARALIYKASEMVDRYFGNVKALTEKGEDEKTIRKSELVARWDKLAKILTPLAKFTASEFACKVAYDAMQVHGGVGYTEEYPIAKIFRDARITTIYEGTTQLQVLAIIGGVVEGVNPTSHLSQYFHELLGGVAEEKYKKVIAGYWTELGELTSIYKEQEKPVKEHIALELCWHLAYAIMAVFLAKQLQIAKTAGHDIVTEKERALNSLLLLADAQIAGGRATIARMTRTGA